MGFQPFLFQLFKEVGLACCREGGVQGSSGSGAMVGVVDIVVACPNDGGITADHHLWTKTTDFSHKLTTQFHGGHQHAIWLAQENYLLCAYDFSRGALLGFSDFSRSSLGHARFCDAYISTGTKHIAQSRSGTRPARQRPATREFDIVWVGNNN